MGNCVNRNSKEVIKLAGEMEISPAVLAAKIGIWQTKNNILDRFPTKEEILDLKPTQDKKNKLSKEDYLNAKQVIKETLEDKKITLIEEANKEFLHPSLIENGYSFSNLSPIIEAISLIPVSKSHLLKYTPLEYIKLKTEEFEKGVEFENSERLKELEEEVTKSVNAAPIEGFSGAILPTGEVIDSFEEFQEILNNLENADFDFDFDESFTPGSSTTVVNQQFIDLNTDVLLEEKENLIKDLENSLEQIRKEIIQSKDAKKNKELYRKKFKVEEQIKDIKDAIDDFKKVNNNLTKVEKIKILFDQDSKIISEILEEPTAENIKLAKKLLNVFNINREPNKIKGVFLSTLSNTSRNSLVLDENGKEIVKYLNNLYYLLEAKAEDAVDKFTISIIKAHENKLAALFPGLTEEEVKDALLAPTEDINIIDQYLMGQGAALSSNDLFEQLQRVIAEQKEIKETNKANEIIREINDVLPELEAEMGKQNKSFTYSRNKVLKVAQKIFVTFRNFGIKTANVITGKEKIYEVLNYTDLFFRKDILDNELINRFTKNWENFIKEANKFSYRNNLELQKKFDLLKDKAEFLNLGLLHDLYTDPNDTNKKGTPAEALQYKKELINKIGEDAYEDLIKHQKYLIDNFENFVKTTTQRFLDKHGVQDVANLENKEKEILQGVLKKANPFAFSEEFHSSSSNKFKNGNYQILYSMLYNSYIPKKIDSQGNETDFYDENFDEILNNPVFLKSWRIFKKATELITSNLTDSELKLGTYNIPSVDKMFKELFLANNLKDTLKKLIPTKSTLSNTSFYFKSILSQKTEVYTDNSVKTPSQIMNVKTKIEKVFSDLKIELNNEIFGFEKLGNKTKIDLDNITNKELFFNILGISNEQEFVKMVTLDSKRNFEIGDLRVFAHKVVMDKQTIDLPTVLKMLLEQSAIFNGRVEAKKEIDTLRLQEDVVDNEENPLTGKKELKRKRARSKTNYFYERALLGNYSPKEMLNISEYFIKENSINRKNIRNVYSTKFIKTFFYKNMTADDKRLFNIYAKRHEKIDEILETIPAGKSTKDDKRRLELYEEQRKIENKLDSLGESYTIGAILRFLTTSTTLFAALGYSVVVPFFNYLNARQNFKTTGLKYYNEKSVDLAWAFVEMNSLRRVNKEYDQNWDILTHFVGKFNIIQDATNEFQRAEKIHRNQAPELFTKKWLTNPMYGTEFIEYYNQLPNVVAGLMNQTILDPVTNEEIPLFDGKSFTAHEIVDGKLVLKPQFRTPENISNFENFDSQSSIEFIGGIKNAIRELNGDYSLLGSVLAKKTLGGAIIMMFKTWMGKKIESAFKIERKNLMTGRTENGYISGTLVDKETRLKGSGLLLGLIATGAITSSALISAPFIAVGSLGLLGIAGYTAYFGAKKVKSRFGSDPDQEASYLMPSITTIGETLKYLLWETAIKETAKYPLKFITSMAAPFGLKLPKEYLYDITKIEDQTEGERNLKVLQQKLVMSFYSMLLPYLVAALLGVDDDEEEPKRGNKEAREHWIKKHNEEYVKREKMINALKNISQKTLDENHFEVLPTQIVDGIIANNSQIETGGQGVKNIGLLIELAQYIYKDTPDIVTNVKSIDYGSTEVGSKFRKAVVPGAFRNYTKEAWNFGIETLTLRDKTDNSIMDSFDDTDYKKDKKKVTKTNAQIRADKRKEYSSKFYQKDYENLTAEQRIYVDEFVEENSKKEGVNRKDYDINQKKIKK